MANKSVLELAVQTGQWDAGLKKAKTALQNFTDASGGLQKALTEDSASMQKFVQMMGRTDSQAKTAKGQLNDYKSTIEQLTMQYNQMNDAQKQSIGQDYLRSIDQLKQKYQAVNQQIQEMNRSLAETPDMKPASGGGGLFGGGKLDGMLQVFGGNVMTKIAGMGAGLVTELGDAVKQGIELAKQGEGIRIAFERLGRGDILQGLREATHGTVTDLELMKAAVKFNDFKLPLDELGTMLAFAQQKAKDTGQSVDYMVDSIVTGLGRKSLMILDNLGLSAAQIKEKMAETGDMTKAVGAIIREEMTKAGDYVETAADRATQANVQLENAMTRLGETFQPLTDTANSMWTSIKVGALDLLNNAIRPLINAFTEAGRARALYEKQGGDTRVNRQIDRLKGIQNDNYRRGTYKAQLRNYDTQIASHEQYLKDYKAWQRDNTNVGAYNRMQAFQQQTGLQWVSDVQAHLDAFKKMRAEYVQGAKAILSPVKANIDTTDAEQNVASLTKKLKELQEQRKKAIAAGDTDLSKNLQKQINQVKADIKGLGGTTTTTTKQQTPQQRAQESFTKAEQNYKQALEQAAMELQAGTITRAEAKKKEMQAAEARWKAIGDARNINDSDSLRQAQDEAAAEYKRLSAEAKTATEHQKAVDKATRDLENANQKLATARTEMAQAKQQGDLQAYNAAKEKAAAAQQEITRLEKVKVNVETGTVHLPDIPATTTTTVDFQANTRNIDAAISDVKKEMDTIPVGTIEFNLDQTKLVDLTTLKTLISEQVKNGLQIDPNATQGLFSKIQLGVDIDDTTWQELIDKINEKLKELDIKPVSINFKTGEKTDKKNEKQGQNVSFSNEMANITQSVSGIVSGIEQLGVDIPEGLKSVLGGIQAVAGILTGISALVTIITAIQGTKSVPVVGWMLARGGVVHAAGGYQVPGNRMSGDQVPAMLNSGELVLNKFQQQVLAANLQSGGLQGLHLEASVHAEQIRLALNNNGKRTGRGELVTWKR